MIEVEFVMKCSNCGSNIPANAKFCGVCGAAVQPAEAKSALETVAFDPSSDPEFKAAAEKLQAANQQENEAKATPAAKSTEPEQAKKKSAKTVQKTAPAKVEEKTPSQPKQSSAPQPDNDADESAAKKKGKFRETIWFMQADDPEMMSSIENEDLDEREATYQDPGGNLDERSREKFSLNISESSMMKAVERDTLHQDGSPESSKSWFYASMVIGAVSLGYVVYLIFAK
jgi:cobalamin biosynthesis Mg chelatase CobN